jgi:RimJ/RimL family protein N-acetyltransferase
LTRFFSGASASAGALQFRIEPMSVQQDEREALSSSPPAAVYSKRAVLRGGQAYVLRALRPKDRDALLAAVDRTSPESLYRRFFGPKHYFSEEEEAYFLKIDFVGHVALVAEIEENGLPAIIGGGRYVTVAPGRAELAFAVIDECQGQGVGAALMNSLLEIARGAGIREFVAEVLPHNIPMIRLFEKSGLRLKRQITPDALHFILETNST